MIREGLTASYLREILQGIHADDDVYMIALYTSEADLSPETTTYTPREEVTAMGYIAGGTVLGGLRIVTEGASALMGWDDPIWNRTSIRARGALIYNATKAKRAVIVIDFGDDILSLDAPFTVAFPTMGDGAVIRLESA